MKSALRFVFLLLAISASACTALPPRSQEWQTSVQQTDFPLKTTTKWVAYSPDWIADTKEAYSDATRYIDHYSRHHPKSAWVVVMDLDQTVLNNIQYQIDLDRHGTTFNPGTWWAWVERRQATLIPGAKAFIESVRSQGGIVVFVSNRRTYEGNATIDNLEAQGIQANRDYAIILFRQWPDGTASKQERFAMIPQRLRQMDFGNVEIAAYVGDETNDWLKTSDTAFFCIPQGDLYGSPCPAHRMALLQHNVRIR